MSTLNRKAWGDLTRHRARTLLAVCTLSIAIASLGFLAVPALLNAAMNRQIAGSHLYDVGISTSTLDLSPAQLRALGRLPGVAAVSPAVGYATTVTSAAGPQDVEIAGTALASAPVNTVALFTGRMPGPGEVLADAGNARATGFAVPDRRHDRRAGRQRQAGAAAGQRYRAEPGRDPRRERLDHAGLLRPDGHGAGAARRPRVQLPGVPAHRRQPRPRSPGWSPRCAPT